MASNIANQVRRPKSNGNTQTQSYLNQIEASGRPWWADLPVVAGLCFQVAIAPFKAIAVAADFLVAITFLALIATISLWWTGHIPDQMVADLMADVGGRILSILEKSGLL